MKFSADLNVINRVIREIRFLPTKNFNTWASGNVASVEIFVYNAISARATTAISIAVTPKVDHPVLKLPGEILKPIVATGQFNCMYFPAKNYLDLNTNFTPGCLNLT